MEAVLLLVGVDHRGIAPAKAKAGLSFPVVVEPVDTTWAAVGAAMRPRSYSWLKSDYHRIAARRGKKIAAVAVGRKILTLVFYGLRDGEVRCLAEGAA